MLKTCERCGKSYHHYNANNKWCSPNCRSISIKANALARRNSKKKDLVLPKHRWAQLKGRIKDKGFDYTMDLATYTQLITQLCYYCYKITYGIEKGVGLDRIDNSIGYEETNVLPCCGSCNRSRSDVWTVKQFKHMIDSLESFEEEE